MRTSAVGAAVLLHVAQGHRKTFIHSDSVFNKLDQSVSDTDRTLLILKTHHSGVLPSED